MADTDRMTRNRFGTFGGVFTPCTLTILGVIMFLRFGQVVGNAGIWRALMIVALAKLITTLTAFSLSAIATNTQVKGGGAYYLISRSLGIEFGGAIGLVFFLSQAISVAMYVIGFTEALVATWPGIGDFTMIASIVNLVVFICVFIGAGWTIKVQYGILAVLLASIGCFVVGAIDAFDPAQLSRNWESNYQEGIGFWAMFALFFPAATGIMAGANMSGDLASPAKSIPNGTLAAIGFTALVYGGFAILLGGASDHQTLVGDSMVVAHISVWAPAITAGIFAATISSALGSMMGAPRILQALAKDRVFPVLQPFAAVSGASREPRRATILSAIIAQAGIMLGDLNAIAPIITMFFMITYGALNYATFTESHSKNPSWRPAFRFSHWSMALIGCLGCLGAMFLIDPIWAAIGLAVMWGLHRYLARQDLQATWGDVKGGASLEQARRVLLSLEQESYHPKNWRPSILALGAAREERLRVAVFARWLAGRHGLLIFGQVLLGVGPERLERVGKHQRTLRKFSDEHGLQAFPVAIAAMDLQAGARALIQSCGIGAMRPNMLMLGWSRSMERREVYLAMLRDARRLGHSLAILRCRDGENEQAWQVPSGPIDVWWLGMQNGELMLLLAHLLRQNDGWRNRHIRLRRMLSSEKGKAETQAHLQALSDEARIDAECEVVIGDHFPSVVSSCSADASLCILGFRSPLEMEGDFIPMLDAISRDLPRVLLVHSAGGVALTA